MICPIEGLPRQVFGFEVKGRLMRDEIDEMMNDFEASIADGYDVALLIEYHADMVEDPGIDDVRFGNRLSARGRTQRYAFVADSKWQALFDELAHFLDCDARMFPPGQRDAARSWLLEAPFLKNAGNAG